MRSCLCSPSSPCVALFSNGRAGYSLFLLCSHQLQWELSLQLLFCDIELCSRGSRLSQLVLCLSCPPFSDPKSISKPACRLTTANFTWSALCAFLPRSSRLLSGLEIPLSLLLTSLYACILSSLTAVLFCFVLKFHIGRLSIVLLISCSRRPQVRCYESLAGRRDKQLVSCFWAQYIRNWPRLRAALVSD